MRKIVIYFHVVLLSIFLSGCLYPKERLSQNIVPYKDQLLSVQRAVEQYQQAEGGMLPIKTKESDTPIFQKYVIDFNKLSPRYIAEPPGNSFEGGGVFQYVLVDVEEQPTVKLIDLRMVDVIREVKLRLKFYMDEHGYAPFQEILSKDGGYFTLDYEKLGYGDEAPFVISPFTQNNLSLFMDAQGEIYIDYRPDLYEALHQFEHHYIEGDDLRYLLVDQYDFVPAFSVPYTLKNNEPIFFIE